jgi:hypothetical protein
MKGMSAIVHGHSKASKSYPSSSTRKAGSSQASRKHILFSFPAIIHVRITVNKNNTELSRYMTTKLYLVGLNYVTFVFTPVHQHV